LGVRRIMEFNVALLGKWCWRLLVERESLWFKVISTRYGEEGRQVREGGRASSTWWRDIAALCREEWFRDHVSRSVGDGKNTFFWSKVWLGGVPLRHRFSRLYELSKHKEKTVFEMYQLGWWEGGEAWRWRWRLLALEEELTLLLQNVILQVDKVNCWLWNLLTFFLSVVLIII